MTKPEPNQPTREECWAAARQVIAQELARIARDRAAGRLDPETAAYLDRVAPLQQRPAMPVVVPRDEALRRARAVLDRARAEDAADYAAGRMSPERRAVYERLLARRAEREATEPEKRRAPVPTREECVRNLRAVADGIFRRLAAAEAAGTLTPEEAVVVARIRARMAADGQIDPQPGEPHEQP
jgi:hypothetical protein